MKRCLMILPLVLGAQTSFAQESSSDPAKTESTAQAAAAPTWTLSGEAAMEGSYFSNGSYGFANTSKYTHESYRIAEASLISEAHFDKVSVRGLLGFRDRETTLFPDPSSPAAGENSKTLSANLEQLDITYHIDDQLSFSFGRLLTTMGYESVVRKENRIYGFTIAAQSITPGYYEGVRFQYKPADWFKLSLSSYNSMADTVNADDYAGTKTTEASIGGSAGSFSWLTGYIWGTDGISATNSTPASESFKTRYNAWVAYQLEESWVFALSYESRTDKVQSASVSWADSKSLTVSYLASSKFDISARYEMIGNALALGYGTAQDLNSTLLGVHFHLSQNLDTFVEHRLDRASEKVFFNSDGTSNAEDSAQVTTLGALFKF